MKLIDVIANKIIQLLITSNWSIYKLSRMSGLSPKGIQAIINKEYKNIKLYTIYLIASAFNLTLYDFFHDDLFKQELIEE